jgi:hypothetical protein
MIESELHKRYPSGCRVTNKELKQILQMLYDTYGIKAVATATDITRYGYTTRACKIPTDEGRINGLILKLE